MCSSSVFRNQTKSRVRAERSTITHTHTLSPADGVEVAAAVAAVVLLDIAVDQHLLARADQRLRPVGHRLRDLHDGDGAERPARAALGAVDVLLCYVFMRVGVVVVWRGVV